MQPMNSSLVKIADFFMPQDYSISFEINMTRYSNGAQTVLLLTNDSTPSSLGAAPGNRIPWIHIYTQKVRVYFGAFSTIDWNFLVTGTNLPYNQRTIKHIIAQSHK
jgi:hypothetical protein